MYKYYTPSSEYREAEKVPKHIREILGDSDKLKIIYRLCILEKPDEEFVNELKCQPEEVEDIRKFRFLKYRPDETSNGYVLSPKDREALLALVELGVEEKEIIEILNCTPDQFWFSYRHTFFKYQPEHKPGEKPTPNDLKALEYLREIEIVPERIGEILNLSEEQVQEYLYDLALKYQSNRDPGCQNILTLKELQVMGDLKKYGNLSNREIARRIGCNHRTVKESLKRMKTDESSTTYDAMKAREKLVERYTNPRGHYKQETTKEFIEDVNNLRVEKCYSPQGAVTELRMSEKYLGRRSNTICTSTYYKGLKDGYIECEQPLRRGLKKSEPEEKKIHPRENKRKFGRSIEDRPPFKYPDGRIEFGHMELDLLEGSKGGKTAMLFTEKRSHLTILRLLDDKKAESVNQALSDVVYHLQAFSGEENFDKLIKTITTDNGSEFAKLDEIRAIKDKIYYCHPATPKEKGQVERNVNIYREFLPKGQSLDTLTRAEISAINRTVNERRVESLDWASPAEIYILECGKLGMLL